MAEKDDLATLLKRGIPGLGGWHVLRYCKVIKVRDGSGTHRQIKPAAQVEVEVLDAAFVKDESFPDPLTLPVVQFAPFVHALPTVDDICLFAFPYWSAETAVLLGVLWENRKVELKDKDFAVAGANNVVIEAEESLTLDGKGGLVEVKNDAANLKPLLELVLQICQSIVPGSGGSPADPGLVEQATTMIGNLLQES